MDEKKILFPYNFTQKDEKALAWIIQTYSGSGEVKITIFHLYPAVPEIILNKNSVMERMSSSMHYLRTRMAEEESKMVDVQKQLTDDGFKRSQVNYLYLPKKRDVAQEICSHAQEQGYGTIVLNRSGGVAGFFKTSVLSKVVATIKDICVIVVT